MEVRWRSDGGQVEVRWRSGRLSKFTTWSRGVGQVTRLPGEGME